VVVVVVNPITDDTEYANNNNSMTKLRKKDVILDNIFRWSVYCRLIPTEKEI
jgi:hypothetical protein